MLRLNIPISYLSDTNPTYKEDRTRSDFEIVAQDRKLKVVLMELDPLLIKLKQNT